jgi:hypothetical protein
MSPTARQSLLLVKADEALVPRRYALAATMNGTGERGMEAASRKPDALSHRLGVQCACLMETMCAAKSNNWKIDEHPSVAGGHRASLLPFFLHIYPFVLFLAS